MKFLLLLLFFFWCCWISIDARFSPPSYLESKTRDECVRRCIRWHSWRLLHPTRCESDCASTGLRPSEEQSPTSGQESGNKTYKKREIEESSENELSCPDQCFANPEPEDCTRKCYERLKNGNTKREVEESSENELSCPDQCFANPKPEDCTRKCYERLKNGNTKREVEESSENELSCPDQCFANPKPEECTRKCYARLKNGNTKREVEEEQVHMNWVKEYFRAIKKAHDDVEKRKNAE